MLKNYSRNRPAFIVKLIIVILSLCSSYALVKANTQGPYAPLASAIGPIPGAFCNRINLDAVRLSDNYYCTSELNLALNGQFTSYIFTTNYGFNIPSLTIIDGISVDVERRAGSVKAKDYSVRIIRNGVLGAQEKAQAALWPTSDTYTTYGGSADLWGTSWTFAEINSANFGFAISAMRSGAGVKPCFNPIDHILITVYYTMIPLSVQLTSFTAAPMPEQNVLLEWKTASEINSDFFAVERSADGFNFSEIARIDACGVCASSTSYSFLDELPLAANTGFYRLRVNNLDGAFIYSSILFLQTESLGQVTFYPNPAHEAINIFSSEPINETLTLQLFDLQGRKRSIRWEMISPQQVSVFFSGKEESNGIYFLEGKDAGGMFFRVKIVLAED